MKKIATLFSGATLLLFAACGDSASGPDKNSGDDQIQGPVYNSGPETEATRATDAVQDSSFRDSSMKVTGDSGAHTLPH